MLGKGAIVRSYHMYITTKDVVYGGANIALMNQHGRVRHRNCSDQRQFQVKINSRSIMIGRIAVHIVLLSRSEMELR